MTEYDIGWDNMSMIYMSPNPYFDSFEQPLDLRKYDLMKHPTGGLNLYESNGRVYFTSMEPGLPAAKIPDQTCVCGTWLIKLGDIIVLTIEVVKNAFLELQAKSVSSTSLLFAHPETRPNLSHNGLPIIFSTPFLQAAHDQLNNRWEFSTVANYLRGCSQSHTIVDSGDVLNVVNQVLKLTRGRLLKQTDWLDWQESVYLQLNQYYDQGMFGTPQVVDADTAVFHLVWTYNIKALDGRKKAQCICKGSPLSGQARILNEFHANCVDQTSSHLFYGIAAAENLLIYGAVVSNAFAKAPPPKQGFHIQPDCAFQECMVDNPQEATATTSWQSHPYSVGYAGPFGIATFVGKTRGCHPARPWVDSDGTQTMSLLWYG
jgi:hypothetical protein